MLTDVSDANKSYTKLEVAEKSDLDLIAVKVLRKDCPDFLFPLKMMEIDGETEIRYELTDGVRFCYMPTQMKKREFIELLTNLIQPFKACSDWFLDYHNFVLDENYILVGKNEQSVKYIYVPTKSQTNSDQEIISFFAGLILKMDIKDDQSYTVDLLRVIKSSNANLMTLLEHLQKDHVEKKAAPLAPPKPAEDHMKKIVSFVQDIPEKMAEKKEKQEPVKAEKKTPVREQGTRPGISSGAYGKSDEENRLINNLFGDDEPDKKKDRKKKEKQPKEKAPKEKGAGLFGFLKGKKKEEEEPEEPEELEDIKEPDAWLDGVYTGSGSGFGGDVKVEVTVQDGKIASIKVLSHKDGSSYMSKAKSVINRIISKQTTNVDTVSGATFSSQGIIKAVRNALSKASGTSNTGKMPYPEGIYYGTAQRHPMTMHIWKKQKQLHLMW